MSKPETPIRNLAIGPRTDAGAYHLVDTRTGLSPALTYRWGDERTWTVAFDDDYYAVRLEGFATLEAARESATTVLVALEAARAEVSA